MKIPIVKKSLLFAYFIVGANRFLYASYNLPHIWVDYICELSVNPKFGCPTPSMESKMELSIWYMHIDSYIYFESTRFCWIMRLFTHWNRKVGCQVKFPASSWLLQIPKLFCIWKFNARSWVPKTVQFQFV